MTKQDLRTPDEWMAIKHPNGCILDPDGWRGSNGRPMTDAITEEEFDWRYAECTVKFNC